MFHKQHTRTKRFIIKNAKRLWERALVPYEIIEHYGELHCLTFGQKLSKRGTGTYCPCGA